MITDLIVSQQQKTESNIRKLDKLQRDLKEDILTIKKKREFYDYQLREYKKIQNNKMAVIGIGFLLMWMEFKDRIQRDHLQVQIGKNLYDHDKLAVLIKLSTDRLSLIKEAKKSGVELNEESKKLLKEDKLTFLIEGEYGIFNRDGSNQLIDKYENMNKELSKYKPKRSRERSRETE